MAPSIISSSYYSDNVPLEGDPLEERAPPKETPLRAIASAHTEATEEDELPQERFKFIYRDGDDWIPMEEYPFDRSLFSSVELIANKHAGEGRYLFDTTLWSLHPRNVLKLLWLTAHTSSLSFQQEEFILTNMSPHLLSNWVIMPDLWRVTQERELPMILFPRNITYERSKLCKPRMFRLYGPTSFAMVQFPNHICCYQHNLCAHDQPYVRRRRSSKICLMCSINQRNGPMADI